MEAESDPMLEGLRRALDLASVTLLAAALPGGAAAFDPASTIGLYGAKPMSAAEAAGFSRASLTRAYIPDAIDLSPLMPPPLQQEAGSNVAHATAYAVRGYYSALENAVEPGSVRYTPSAAHFHERIREPEVPCEEADASVATAYREMTSGLVTSAEVPNAAVCEARARAFDGPVDPALGIVSARLLFHTADGAFNQRTHDTLKQTLAQGHPVVATFTLYGVPDETGKRPSTLALLAEGEIYEGSLGDHSGPVGVHSMVIVGYDERRSAYLVQNSWSEAWAGDGYGWVAYRAVERDLVDASYMITSFRPPRPAPGVAADRRNVVALRELAGVPLAPCSHVFTTGLVDTVPRFGGYVSSKAELDALVARDALAPSQIADIKVRPYPVCEAMKTLDPALQAPARPTVRLLDEREPVRIGESLAFEVVSPDFPAFLYVAYLDAEGTVTNLAPRRGPIRRQLPPRTRLVYGDGLHGRQTFTASPPTGDEAVIVVASRSPIFELEALERPGNGQFVMPALDKPGAAETADDRYYLTRLRAGLNDRPDPSALAREVSAAVLHVTIEGSP